MVHRVRHATVGAALEQEMLKIGILEEQEGAEIIAVKGRRAI